MLWQEFRRLLLVGLTLVLLLLTGGYLIWSWVGASLTGVVEKASRPIREEIGLHAKPLSWLSTKGRFIVNEAGEPQILRGVNVSSVNWGKSYWNPKAVEYAVTNWQAQIIRTRIFQDEYEQDPEAFFAKMEREIIRPARRLGVYVILHPWIHDNQPLPDQGTILMWQAIAQRYKDDPTILYDVLAEPRGVSREELRQAYIGLIETARAVHPRSLIFVSGLEWGREINSWLENPLPFGNLVYRSNPYNKPGEFEGIFGEIAQEYPVFLGEFGADAYPTMTQESVASLLEYAKRLGIGWTAWNFSAEGCPCLLTDENQFLPSSYGTIVRQALLDHAQAGQSKFIPEPVAEPEIPGVYQIYSDNLKHGFLDFSWGGVVDLSHTKQVFTGESSVKMQFTEPSASLYFNTSVPMSPDSASTLQFWVFLEGFDPQDLEVYLKGEDETLSVKLSISDYMEGSEQGWSQVVMPLAAFNMGGKPITGWFLNKKTDNLGTVYVDDLRLVE